MIIIQIKYIIASLRDYIQWRQHRPRHGKYIETELQLSEGKP